MSFCFFSTVFYLSFIVKSPQPITGGGRDEALSCIQGLVSMAISIAINVAITLAIALAITLAITVVITIAITLAGMVTNAIPIANAIAISGAWLSSETQIRQL